MALRAGFGKGNGLMFNSLESELNLKVVWVQGLAGDIVISSWARQD